MPTTAELDAFVRKWDLSILAALDTVGESARRAGYATAIPFDDVDLRAEPPALRWLMPVWYPGRPAFLESMDMYVAFTLPPANEGDDMFVPLIELFNVEGSYFDDIELATPLRLEHDAAMQRTVSTLQGKGDDIVVRLDAYFPKPIKRIWKVHVTTPGNVKRHPSITSKEEIAKQETASILKNMIEKISRLFWEMEATRTYSGWNSNTYNALTLVGLKLQDGDVWEALFRYHQFLDLIPASLKDRITKTVGTLTVEKLGGFEGEEETL